jgi:gamma-glutamylcysteine synthetase
VRRIDLTDYETEVLTEDGMKTIPYNVKESIDLAMYHPDLKLGWRELFENDRVAQKIKSANGSVLLEESEYTSIKRVFETIQGFRKQDLELVRRVLEAPKVEVTER